jgi:hypothetical protein
MRCRRCKKDFPQGSLEHLIPDGLGGKTTTDLLYCDGCNVALSGLDRALVEGYDFIRNLLMISGKRNAPSVLVRDEQGEAVMLEPGGKPTFLKPRMKIEETGDKRTLRVRVPPHLWSQYKKKVEATIGRPVDDFPPRAVADRPTLDAKLELGGAEALRGVAKIAYNFACTHVLRHALRVDLSEVEDFIFEDNQASELCLFDSRKEILEQVPDLANVVAVHFNPHRMSIVASVTLLGSTTYSVLLSRNYAGDESCTIVLRNDPVEPLARDTFATLQLQRDIDTVWLLDRTYWTTGSERTVAGTSQMNSLMEKAMRFNRRSVISEIVEEGMKEAGFYDPRNTVVTEGMLARLSAHVAGEYSRLVAAGMDSSRVRTRSTHEPNGQG